MSPLGLGLLGCRIGEILELCDAGSNQQLQIADIEYQPEASGNFLM